MSRIGKQPIPVPDSVTVEIKRGSVSVKGPHGELSERIDPAMTVEMNDSVITVTRPTDSGHHRALHGLARSLIYNMVTNCANGYQKELAIQGVGYRAALKGKSIELSVGYSHTVLIDPPAGVEIEIP